MNRQCTANFTKINNSSRKKLITKNSNQDITKMSVIIVTIILVGIVLVIVLYKKRLQGFDRDRLGYQVGEAKLGETRILRGCDA